MHNVFIQFEQFINHSTDTPTHEQSMSFPFSSTVNAAIVNKFYVCVCVRHAIYIILFNCADDVRFYSAKKNLFDLNYTYFATMRWQRIDRFASKMTVWRDFELFHHTLHCTVGHKLKN